MTVYVFLFCCNVFYVWFCFVSLACHMYAFIFIYLFFLKKKKKKKYGNVRMRISSVMCHDNNEQTDKVMKLYTLARL